MRISVCSRMMTNHCSSVGKKIKCYCMFLTSCYKTGCFLPAVWFLGSKFYCCTHTASFTFEWSFNEASQIEDTVNLYCKTFVFIYCCDNVYLWLCSFGLSRRVDWLAEANVLEKRTVSICRARTVNYNEYSSIRRHLTNSVYVLCLCWS
jgi:hypothetical protein